MRLEGKTVVMTGAAGGIGSLLCRELAAKGARRHRHRPRRLRRMRRDDHRRPARARRA